MRSLTFSPDGKIASGSYDRTVKLGHIKTGKCIHMAGHPGSLLSVAFSPDGTLLASSGYEQIIKLWDVATGECLKAWEAHRSREGTNIIGARGLTESEKTSFKLLGVVEKKEIWALLNLGMKMILRDFKTNVETLQCNVSLPKFIHLIGNAEICSV